MNLKFESGRSMTEILGVMVIVSVLSVGGITGYSYGMNKHKSNTLLQEANLRAMVVSKQIGFHHQSPSLDEFKERDFGYGIFDDKVYGENASSAWTTSDKKFSLKIQSVSQPVCQNLQNEAGGIIQGFSPAECTDDAVVVLTYNNDLSTTEITGADCSAYNGTSSSNTGGYAGLATDGETHCKCPIGQKWSGDKGSCEDTNECTSYNTQECKEGFYCSFDDSATCDNCSENGGGTCTPGVGTCKALTDGTKMSVSADGYAGLLTGKQMNWWTANSWCIAHGMQIPSLSEFGCTRDSSAASGWTCDWSRFKTSGQLHKSNWWVSDDPDCRARNLNVPNSTVDFDTPRIKRWYSTLCTNGEVQKVVLAQVGETCTNTADCASGLFCNTAKKCQEKLDDGLVCPSSEACKSGYCGQNGSGSDVCFTSCTSYTTKECADGYYCVFNYPEKCSERGVGACVPIMSAVELTADKDGVDGLYFSTSMNWWSANALCTAYGKHLASLEEMDCNADPDRNCDNWPRFYKGLLRDDSWWAADLYNNCIGYNVTMNGGRVDHDTGLDNDIYYSVVCK